MVTSPDCIVSRFDEKCVQLLALVRSSSSDTTAYDMETEVFQGVLGLGRLLMQAYFAEQAPQFHWPVACDPEGRNLPYTGERTGLFYSAFGEVPFKRSYYSGDGHGFFPLDAALNLPPTGASDFLRMMREDLSLDMSFERASAHVAKYFPVSTSTRAVQSAILTDSLDIEAYYAQAPAPPPIENATVLVVQGDGKGVPMVKSDLSAATLKQASKNLRQPGRPNGPRGREGKKKEATAISVAVHKPFVRTPEQVVCALFEEQTTSPDPREPAAHKRVWATMSGKINALKQAKFWADQIDADHIVDRVTLTDGQPSLQRYFDEAFPNYTRVLDLMHALSYLWNAADVHFGTCTAGREWVRDAVLRMLRGEVASVIEEIDDWRSKIKSAGKLILERSVEYLRRNRSAMAYDRYLARGWPIATGMIEGTCRHIVKDRCERGGMRWTGKGVEAILHLRCINHNGDWDDYHAFRMRRRQIRDYGRTPNGLPELTEPTVYRKDTGTRYADAA